MVIRWKERLLMKARRVTPRKQNSALSSNSPRNLLLTKRGQEEAKILSGGFETWFPVREDREERGG